MKAKDLYNALLVGNSGGGVTPTGTINITENGTYDVTDKATAVVDNAVLRATLDNSVVSPVSVLVIPSDITTLRSLKDLRATAAQGAEVLTIIENAMYGCSIITSISFPKCTTINESGIREFSSLVTANLPLLQQIGNHNFRGCGSITTISLPELTTIGTNCFYKLSSCTKIVIPKLTKLTNDSMLDVPIVNLSLPSCTEMQNSIRGCTSLANLFLPGSTMCAITHSNCFSNTPIKSGTGTIWVNDDLVDDYKAASNWVNYASQIKAISEYTGSFDYNEGVA